MLILGMKGLYQFNAISISLYLLPDENIYHNSNIGLKHLYSIEKVFLLPNEPLLLTSCVDHGKKISGNVDE